jgi:hypothetical protein
VLAAHNLLDGWDNVQHELSSPVLFGIVGLGPIVVYWRSGTRYVLRVRVRFAK